MGRGTRGDDKSELEDRGPSSCSGCSVMPPSHMTCSPAKSSLPTPSRVISHPGEDVALLLTLVQSRSRSRGKSLNPDAFRGRGVVRIFTEEGTTLYRGWGWTAACLDKARERVSLSLDRSQHSFRVTEETVGLESTSRCRTRTRARSKPGAGPSGPRECTRPSAGLISPRM
jgi:hypothetical protein